MKKLEKTFFVQNLTEELKLAKSVVLVNFATLSFKNQRELAKRLKEVQARFIVVKNTLLKKAGEQAKIDSQVLSDTVLTGQTALIVADSDPIAPIQVLGRFVKEFETPRFKVGIIEGAFQDSEVLKKLSTLPSREVAASQLSATLMGVTYGLFETLNANMQRLVYILNTECKN